jgi:hypothetical protein
MPRIIAPARKPAEGKNRAEHPPCLSRTGSIEIGDLRRNDLLRLPAPVPGCFPRSAAVSASAATCRRASDNYTRIGRLRTAPNGRPQLYRRIFTSLRGRTPLPYRAQISPFGAALSATRYRRSRAHPPRLLPARSWGRGRPGRGSACGRIRPTSRTTGIRCAPGPTGAAGTPTDRPTRCPRPKPRRPITVYECDSCGSERSAISAARPAGRSCAA